jgi:hypothetical protein
VNHAIYFVGYKIVGTGATELLGLDPHRYWENSDYGDSSSSSSSSSGGGGGGGGGVGDG